MEDLLERPVGVAQPAGILAGVDPALGTLTAGDDELVPCESRLRGGGGRGGLARRPEREEVAVFLGRGVQALPQQRERLRSVQRVGLDPGRAQRRLDLRGNPRAVARRLVCADHRSGLANWQRAP